MAEDSFINPLSIIMVSSVGLVILQLFSIVMEAFGKPPIYIGPFLLAVMIAGAVWTAFGIIKNLLDSPGFNYDAGKTRRYLLLLLFSIALVLVSYIMIPRIVPEIFGPAVVQTRASLVQLIH